MKSQRLTVTRFTLAVRMVAVCALGLVATGCDASAKKVTFECDNKCTIPNYESLRGADLNGKMARLVTMRVIVMTIMSMESTTKKGKEFLNS